MIIFLYGKDGYRLKQNLEKIVAEYHKKNANGMGFLSLDISELPEGIKKLEDAIKTVSFFNEKRLFAVKNIFGEAEKLLEIMKNWDLASDKQNILVITENLSQTELVKKSKNLFALLVAKPNISKSFEPLTGRQLENWMNNEVKANGASINTAAVKKLIDYVGDDSWQLSQEISKLASYSQGETINEKIVEQLVLPSVNLSIFETIDAVGAKNKAKALTLLARHLENGDDPYRIFSMFVYEFRNLLRVKSLLAKYMLSSDIAKKTGLHPFVVRKMSEQARKFELEELKQKFSILAQSDIAIKNGQLDIVDCLYQTVLN